MAVGTGLLQTKIDWHGDTAIKIDWHGVALDKNRLVRGYSGHRIFRYGASPRRGAT